MTAWEKFQAATLSLARSGSIKDRLADAYRNHLANVSEDELPRELRDEFRRFSRELTRERPLQRGEDSVRATIRKMSSEEVDRAACTVVRMFCALPRTSGATAASRGTSSSQVIPLYIAEA